MDLRRSEGMAIQQLTIHNWSPAGKARWQKCAAISFSANLASGRETREASSRSPTVGADRSSRNCFWGNRKVETNMPASAEELQRSEGRRERENLAGVGRNFTGCPAAPTGCHNIRRWPEGGRATAGPASHLTLAHGIQSIDEAHLH